MSTDQLTLTIQATHPPLKTQQDAEPIPHRVSAFDLVASQPWAILPAMLETIGAIARREYETVESLEVRLGRPVRKRSDRFAAYENRFHFSIF